MSTVTAIIPCKKRLNHLRECIGTWVAQNMAEVLVIDYNCPQNTEKFIQSIKNNRVACFKEPVAADAWNLSKARNAGWRHAETDILLFLDADTILKPGFLDDALSKLKEDETFVSGLTREPWNGCGCLLVYKSDFERVRGYNELMEGWGFEDIDMYGRLKAAGLEHKNFDPALIENLPHAAATRNEFHGRLDQFDTHNKNAAICATKKFKSVINMGTHISIHSSTVPPEVSEYQKKVFEHFGLEIVQVKSELPHGEAINEWLNNNEFTRVYVWDADAIPTTSELPADAKKLTGIAQQAHHIEGAPIYIGVAYITFTKKMWEKWGRPTFAAGAGSDTGGYVTIASGGFEKAASLWPTHVVTPKWDLGPGSCFGLGTTYQGGIYHAFELRMGNERMFIEKCREILGE